MTVEPNLIDKYFQQFLNLNVMSKPNPLLINIKDVAYDSIRGFILSTHGHLYQVVEVRHQVSTPPEISSPVKHGGDKYNLKLIDQNVEEVFAGMGIGYYM